ncbi:MAG: RluA family pseudouridine synthase [Deltaproteobacteria bacterium]|nr:RluA family pseudouridine synthase [Deltaproteobacteria bacterium]
MSAPRDLDAAALADPDIDELDAVVGASADELDDLDGDPRAPAPPTGAIALPPWRDRDGNPVDMGERSHLEADGTPRIVERRFLVALDHAGGRLDHYLKRMIPRLSRTRIQDVIRHQLVRVGDPTARLKPSTTVAGGDEFVLRRVARAEPPCPRHIEILHADPQVLVVDKPPGLPVHASAKFYFNTLTRVLSERFPDEPLQICHRLDRETSGALVVARDAPTASLIKTAFEKKRVAKTYLAIVHGQPPWPTGDDPAPDHVLDAPLALAQPGDPTLLPHVRMLIRADGLPSVTRVRVLARAGRVALVRCTPITGRQHQIRAHLAWAGYPIVGDKLYAHGDVAFMAFCDRGMTAELYAQFELPRHALHAATVTFPHPARSEPLTVASPLPRDLADYLAAAGDA